MTTQRPGHLPLDNELSFDFLNESQNEIFIAQINNSNQIEEDLELKYHTINTAVSSVCKKTMTAILHLISELEPKRRYSFGGERN